MTGIDEPTADERAALHALFPAPSTAPPDLASLLVQRRAGSRVRRFAVMAAAVAVVMLIAVITVLAVRRPPRSVPAPSTTNPSALIGVHWHLDRLVQPDGRSESPDGSTTMVFSRQAVTDDHDNSAGVTITRGAIVFTRWANGLVLRPGEPPRPSRAQSQFIFTTLAGRTQWIIRGETLIITQPGAGELEFSRSR